ncbi:DUF2125 domain-containing protein [Rhodalgimonas zhirmunskyi]|uniref:DUF2125 domain-containing protein n=1 Tax=Rhodalgimonas zhirmunskyi TaxID=2964767 RepID=A0AAJ1UB13_9RHOB|nr:DUF2125 domain-containing protein [Rhodoalgimonas zhirmunskyi]MDQ2094528.1 DUF2125 domain-containing protein [Rhodoalgimonas zhirmunskyi]
MSSFKNLSGTTALALIITGSAAFADVSAQDVWGDWKGYMESMGYSVTATEATSGDTLTTSDLSMTMPLPEDEGTITIMMGEISYTNQGDGTVAVTIPASEAVNVKIVGGGESVEVPMTLTQNGFNAIVSGTPQEMTYTYSAVNLGLDVQSVTANGETVPVEKGIFSLTDVAGATTTKTGNLRNVTQQMKAGALGYAFKFANPDAADEYVDVQGDLKGLSFEGAGDYPMGQMNSDDMNAMIKAGFNFAGKFVHSGGQMNFLFTEEGDQITANTSTTGGSVDAAMSEKGLQYSVGASGLKVNFQGGDVPFPVSFEAGQIGYDVAVPVVKSDDTQDFSMGIALRDFVMSEQIWGMIDPGAQLPRDPATIALDVSGTGKLGFDLLDEAQMAAVESGETMPGDLQTLKIEELEITAAGASVTGTGAADVDMQAAMMSQGANGIDGTLNLKIVGANGLMDKLVAMGLVPQDQMMGARMMMGMFAVPGEGEDTLTSTLEIKKSGEISANGQRIK